MTDRTEFLYKEWPKIGLVVALFLLLMLFLNSKVPIGSFDWFYWFSLPLYMIHQFEEYVYPGGFITEMNKILSRGGPSREILTDKMAFIINIGFIWVMTPVLIVLGTLSLIFPIILMTLVAANGFIHGFASLRFRHYNPGLIVSLTGNIPLGLYVLIGLGLNGIATTLEMIVGILLGVILHALLFVVLGLRARKTTQP